MTPDELILAAIVAGCITIVALALIRRIFPMAVDPRVQTSLDEIAASMAALAAKPAPVDQSAELAQMAQDATDTASAVQATSDAVKAAVGA